MDFEPTYNAPKFLDIELNLTKTYSAPAIIINKVSWYWIEIKLVFYFEASYNGPNLLDIGIE